MIVLLNMLMALALIGVTALLVTLSIRHDEAVIAGIFRLTPREQRPNREDDPPPPWRFHRDELDCVVQAGQPDPARGTSRDLVGS